MKIFLQSNSRKLKCYHMNSIKKNKSHDKCFIFNKPKKKKKKKNESTTTHFFALKLHHLFDKFM